MLHEYNKYCSGISVHTCLPSMGANRGRVQEALETEDGTRFPLLERLPALEMRLW